MAKKTKQDLIESVVEQIKEDVHFHEYEALEELLSFIPIKNLIVFLSEDENKQFKHLENEETSINVKDLISFLEYEEAYTVDPKSQRRIRAKLEELKVWEKNK